MSCLSLSDVTDCVQLLALSSFFRANQLTLSAMLSHEQEELNELLHRTDGAPFHTLDRARTGASDQHLHGLEASVVLTTTSPSGPGPRVCSTELISRKVGGSTTGAQPRERTRLKKKRLR